MADIQTPNPPAPQADEDEFIKKYSPIDEDSFVNKYRPGDKSSSLGLEGFADPGLTTFQDHFIKQGPFSGPEADHMFSQSGAGKVLSAIGQGAEDGWGQDSALSNELKFEATRKDADKGIVSGVHDAVMRPLSAGIDFMFKSLYAAGGAFSGAAGQLGQNLTEKAQELSTADPNHPDIGKAIGFIPGIPGELLKDLASGAIPEGLHLGPAHIDHLQQLQEARSRGLIGEGEEGFFNAQKVSPENLQRRDTAAKEAGLPPQVPVDQVPTVPELAREIDPDTFKKLDNLSDLKENLQLSLQSERTRYQQALENGMSEDHPEQVSRLQSITDLQDKIQKSDEGLRDIIPDVADAKNRTQELLESQTPEGDQYRNYVQAQAFERALALEDLKPKVLEATDRASELKSDPTKIKEPSESDTGPKLKIKPKVKTPETEATDSAVQELSSIRPTGESADASKPSLGSQGNSLKEVSGPGEDRFLSLSQKLRADAIQKGFEGDFGEEPWYQSITHKNQGELAVYFADKSPQEAMKVAMGQSPAPEGVYPEAILWAVKEQLEASGDSEGIRRLAGTSLAREAKTMGQRLGLLRGLNDLDPAGLIQHIQESWKEAGKNNLDKTVNDIKKAVQDHLNNIQIPWNEFVKSIECDY